jgi:hypothetical protein
MSSPVRSKSSHLQESGIEKQILSDIFFGHSHEDQVSIFYANNGTKMAAETAGTVAWVRFVEAMTLNLSNLTINV